MWLVHSLLLLPVSGIVCPPELLQAAPVGLLQGSKCGGTCHEHGHCARGLSCQQPEPLLKLFPSDRRLETALKGPRNGLFACFWGTLGL